MVIHHSKFDEMFNCLKGDIPMSLSEAVNRWVNLKYTKKTTPDKWIQILEKKTMQLVNESYSVGTAMMKSWEEYYPPMVEDGERGYLNISDLRDTFFNNSLDKLEAYEDNLIDNTDRYPCKDCGWFIWNHISNEGYCNNFSLVRSEDSKCISEGE